MKRVPADLLPGMKTILNAVENASTVAITPDGIAAVLKGQGGHPSHLRAIFGDVSFRVLEQVGAGLEIETATILAAYRAARTEAGAANPQLDEALDELS